MEKNALTDDKNFMQELEVYQDMRTRVNIIKFNIAVSKETDEENEEEDCDENEEDKENNQKITLDQLWDNLVLDPKPDVEVNAMLGDTSLEEAGGLEERQVI